MNVKVVDFEDKFILRDRDGTAFEFILCHGIYDYPEVEIVNFHLNEYFGCLRKVPKDLIHCKNYKKYGEFSDENQRGCYNLTDPYIIFCYLTNTEPICCKCYHRHLLSQTLKDIKWK